jgi:hypothetical protein
MLGQRLNGVPTVSKWCCGLTLHQQNDYINGYAWCVRNHHPCRVSEGVCVPMRTHVLPRLPPSQPDTRVIEGPALTLTLHCVVSVHRHGRLLP